MTQAKPFGIPLTEEFLKFLGVSFTVEECMEAFHRYEDGDEDAMAPFRAEINSGLKSVPRIWMTYVRGDWAKNNSWPLTGDEMVMYRFGNGISKYVPIKTVWPNKFV